MERTAKGNQMTTLDEIQARHERLAASYKERCSCCEPSQAHKDRAALLAALRAVEVLHVVDEQGKCAECTVAPFSMHSVKYPCPTITAIREALS